MASTCIYVRRRVDRIGGELGPACRLDPKGSEENYRRSHTFSLPHHLGEGTTSHSSTDPLANNAQEPALVLQVILGLESQICASPVRGLPRQVTVRIALRPESNSRPGVPGDVVREVDNPSHVIAALALVLLELVADSRQALVRFRAEHLQLIVVHVIPCSFVFKSEFLPVLTSAWSDSKFATVATVSLASPFFLDAIAVGPVPDEVV